MNPIARLLRYIRRLIYLFYALTVTKWEGKLFLYLAVGFTLFVIADATFFHLTVNMRQAAFDMMMRRRIVIPKPDPDIVIVDINEASLAAMAKSYGRWPWPRQVLGEFLEHLEQQKPRAVIFDILFSDPDVYNPDSDAYFDAAIAATNNTYFPMLRLDPDNDALSELFPKMVPGIEPIPGEAWDDVPIALILPHFQSALQGGRLGINNIYPDADGTVREYVVYRNDYGWKVPSLPARVARELGYGVPDAERVLLNWRGKPFTYPMVTFSDVYNDMLSREKKRPQNEFSGKIVIIGSTAPSLFDVKPTPLAELHPGVEILATAVDNMKRNDYLRYPEGRVIYPVLSLFLVWATAWVFYRNVGRDKINLLFGTSQSIMLGISYASINFTTTYINLTGPFAVGLAFFSLARIYSTAVNKVFGTPTLRASTWGSGELVGILLLVHVNDPQRVVVESTMRKICRRIEATGREERSVEWLSGGQFGIWALFERTLAVSWVFEVDDRAEREKVEQDIQTVTQALPSILVRFLGPDAGSVRWHTHEGRIPRGQNARAAWRALFAETLLKFSIQQPDTDPSTMNEGGPS